MWGAARQRTGGSVVGCARTEVRLRGDIDRKRRAMLCEREDSAVALFDLGQLTAVESLSLKHQVSSLETLDVVE